MKQLRTKKANPDFREKAEEALKRKTQRNHPDFTVVKR